MWDLRHSPSIYWKNELIRIIKNYLFYEGKTQYKEKYLDWFIHLKAVSWTPTWLSKTELRLIVHPSLMFSDHLTSTSMQKTSARESLAIKSLPKDMQAPVIHLVICIFCMALRTVLAFTLLSWPITCVISSTVFCDHFADALDVFDRYFSNWSSSSSSKTWTTEFFLFTSWAACTPEMTFCRRKAPCRLSLSYTSLSNKR